MSVTNKNEAVYVKVAKLTFIIFLFFAFFGTSLPFQQRVRDVSEINTSNIITQIVYSLLFLASCFTLIPKRQELVALFKKEKFLTIFIIWCVLSIAWSKYSYVSFKRLFQIIAVMAVNVSFLLYIDSDSKIMAYFKSILYTYIILSLISVIFIPGATDPVHLTWRGLERTKNHLGQMSLISVILCSIALNSDHSLTKKFLNCLMLLISLMLLIGSNSSTAILSFLVFLMMCVLLFFNYIFKPLGIGNSFSIIVISSFLLILITINYLAPDLIDIMPRAFGKDMTFSGRTELWHDMLLEIEKHPILGTGFQGFWIMENIDLLVLYDKFVWIPLQSHNGYLDILNEIGVIGLAIFILMLVYYFINLSRLKETHPWKYLIIIVLIINIQETNLFRPGIFAGMMFIFGYLVLYVKLLHRDQHIATSNG